MSRQSSGLNSDDVNRLHTSYSCTTPLPHVVKPNLSSLGPLASFCIFSHLRASTASLLPWTATRATSAAPSAPAEPSRSPPTPGRRARPIVRPQPPRRRPLANARGRRGRGYQMELTRRLRRAARVAFAYSVAGATFVAPVFRMAPFKPRTSTRGMATNVVRWLQPPEHPPTVGLRVTVRWASESGKWFAGAVVAISPGWPPDLSRPVRRWRHSLGGTRPLATCLGALPTPPLGEEAFTETTEPSSVAPTEAGKDGRALLSSHCNSLLRVSLPRACVRSSTFTRACARWLLYCGCYRERSLPSRML